MRTSIFAFLLLLLFVGTGWAQQPEGPGYPQLSVDGYIKDLQTLFIVDNPLGGDAIVASQNQIHNRINSRLSFSRAWSLKLDLRNRLFWGDQLTDDFLDQLDAANDWLDLSLADNGANDRIAYHTMIDRLFLEFVKGNWEVRLGRQRINWGINTLWNPNDIFNAFNFTDFDYEERPGSDALRIRYYTGFASSLELAVRAFDDPKEAVIAGMWRFNQWNYDFQVLSGYYREEIALGGGWAGNIKGAGFKGEFTFFAPLNDNDPSFAGSLGVDYLTANSFYLNGGFLFNSNGRTEGSLATIFNFELSAQNLYPYKYSVFVQSSYPITPLC
jgi:hypothetical protein